MKGLQRRVWALFLVVIAIILLITAFNSFMAVNKGPDKKESINQTLVRYVEQDLQRQLRQNSSTNLESLYYTFMTLNMLDSSLRDLYASDVLNYIRDNFYTDSIVSNQKTKERGIVKATFMTVDLDTAVEPDLNRGLNLPDLLWKAKQEINGTEGLGHQLNFYLARLIRLTGFRGAYWGYFDHYFDRSYCDYAPGVGTDLADLYFTSLVFEERGRREALEEGEYSYQVYNSSSTMNCFKLRNLTERTRCLRNREIKQVNRSCSTENYSQEVLARIRQFGSRRRDVGDLEQLFMLYRLKKAYGLDGGQVTMTVRDRFYNQKEGYFSLSPDGRLTSPRANFYGACILTNCNRAGAW